MRPPSTPSIRRTLLLCAALPLALTVQLCGLAVLVAVVPGQPPTPTVPVAALAVPVAGPAPTGRFRWPVDGPPRPVRRFDPPPRPWLSGHRGVDLAAPAGAVIRSAGPGTVLFAGMVAGRPVITVGHADGLRTTHEPVRPAVRPGQQVTAGTPLGELLPGHPGCPAEACLHWGLRRGTDYLDPLALLGLGPVRLVPVGPLPVSAPGRPVNAGRAVPAAVRPAARTRRRCCRPDR
ncbi:M23 family metallopeptidase [Micromonospora sp. WMMD961]|uniref:murein hydrolase activator EnvC family protein n=1 Tax=Micromonospora sp. WMMD961 TaxID=3016100 RepID=UPI002417EB8B|nr:M23 family metallopeptidase [Micromonospora sp. WMMD961]MDG4779696.1 M23 family metallopeptidase [Micromonospora sp. WMMD961]